LDYAIQPQVQPYCTEHVPQHLFAVLLQNRWHLVGRDSFDRLLGIKLALLASQLLCVFLKAVLLYTFAAFRSAFKLHVAVQNLPYVQNHHPKSASTSVLETALQNFCQQNTPSIAKYLCTIF
jgi:hypothetical protein